MNQNNTSFLPVAVSVICMLEKQGKWLMWAILFIISTCVYVWVCARNQTQGLVTLHNGSTPELHEFKIDFNLSVCLWECECMHVDTWPKEGVGCPPLSVSSYPSRQGLFPQPGACVFSAKLKPPSHSEPSLCPPWSWGCKRVPDTWLVIWMLRSSW